MNFSYDYNIEVKISSPAPTGLLNLNSRQDSKVIIKAEHVFGNFTQRINVSDKIWFKGILRTSLNSPSSDDFVVRKLQEKDTSLYKYTRVELTAIGCLHCSDKNLSPISLKNKLKVENRIEDFRRALKYLLNVLFNPLVTFK